MPIVLAIEPDRRQAAHVSAVVRHRVGAELILADTTEGALDAIGTRVPDLVLVPALLSPQDDAALAAALRVIAAAAHVRTLTIPVFANGSSREDGGGGLLARFRRGRSESSSVGCDPAVFAEQINDYLREAADERAELQTSPWIDETAAEPQRHESPFIESSFIESPPQEAPLTEPVRLIAPAVVNRPAAPTARPLAEIDSSTAEFVDRAFILPAAPEQAFVEATAAAAPSDQILVDLSDAVGEIAPAASSLDEPLFDGEAFGAYTLSLDEPLGPTRDAIAPPAAGGAARPSDQLVEEFAAAEAELTAEAPVVEPLANTPPDTSAWLTLGLRYTRQWPTMEGATVEAATPLTEFVAALAHKTAALEAVARPAAVVAPATPAAPRPDHLDWAELVASLRQDIERRRKHPNPSPAPPPPKPAEAPARPQLRAIDGASEHRSRKLTPLQDEWGFFDPQQCGFAALLAKLDEFSDSDEPEVRKTS